MSVSSKLRLMFSPAQQVFVFVFGDSPQRMGDGPLHFKTKREAITAARRQGLDVDKKGYVKSYEMVEMEALLSKRGYNPADASLLMSEGMGPHELESRLKHSPGSVGSLEHSHNLKKVRRDSGLSGLTVHGTKLDTFTTQYLETAMWSTNDESNDQGGDPIDANYSLSDFSPEALKSAIRDCNKFQEENGDDIASDLSGAGHDFWLTRNGHGAGFWDGDWPEPAAKRLTKASKAFGSVDLYVGDDGKLHFSP